MIPLVLSESVTRNSFHGYIFLASVNPGPSTEFQSRNGTVENFVFSIQTHYEVSETIDPTYMHLPPAALLTLLSGSLLIHSRKKDVGITRLHT